MEGIVPFLEVDLPVAVPNGMKVASLDSSFLAAIPILFAWLNLREPCPLSSSMVCQLPFPVWARIFKTLTSSKGQLKLALLPLAFFFMDRFVYRQCLAKALILSSVV